MNLFRKIYYTLTPGLRMFVRKILFSPVDALDRIRKRKSKYQPPKADIYIGRGDFIAQGRHHLDLLKKHVSLNTDDSVLDIGCGIGRTAVALTTYLSSAGSYEGFDVVEKGVKWCNKNIKRDFSNFNFKYVPLANRLYNSNLQDARLFKFPYIDHLFDKIFLFSVFTHMTIEEIANYLNEIKRVIKPGGLCLATFFIYKHAEDAFFESNHGFNFPVKRNGYRLMSASLQYANIALEQTLLENMINESGLNIREQIDGYWKNEDFKSPDNDFQDIVILEA